MRPSTSRRARDPPVPPHGPAKVVAPGPMSMRQCIDATQLVENAGAVLSDVLAFHAQFPALTKALFGAPPVRDLPSLGPLARHGGRPQRTRGAAWRGGRPWG